MTDSLLENLIITAEQGLCRLPGSRSSLGFRPEDRQDGVPMRTKPTVRLGSLRALVLLETREGSKPKPRAQDGPGDGGRAWGLHVVTMPTETRGRGSTLAAVCSHRNRAWGTDQPQTFFRFSWVFLRRAGAAGDLPQPLLVAVGPRLRGGALSGKAPSGRPAALGTHRLNAGENSVALES